MSRLRLVSTLLGAFVAAPALAQTCDSSKAATALLSQFKAGSGGTLEDTRSGKTWLRCALGMTWDGSTCTGLTLTYNWNGANAAIDELNASRFGGHANWRLPTVVELKGIVEQRCFKPAIDLAAFPYTPETGFWSADEVEGSNPRARIVHFIHGQDYIANKNQSWRVRPVAD